MAGITEMLDDKAQQVLTNATTLESGEKRENNYFSIGIVSEAVTNDRLVFGADKASE